MVKSTLSRSLNLYTPVICATSDSVRVGLYQDCIDACTRLLDVVPTEAASGLAASILRRRATALSTRRLFPDALSDLNRAADLEPGDSATLLLQIQVMRSTIPHHVVGPASMGVLSTSSY